MIVVMVGNIDDVVDLIRSFGFAYVSFLFFCGTCFQMVFIAAGLAISYHQALVPALNWLL